MATRSDARYGDVIVVSTKGAILSPEVWKSFIVGSSLDEETAVWRFTSNRILAEVETGGFFEFDMKPAHVFQLRQDDSGYYIVDGSFGGSKKYLFQEDSEPSWLGRAMKQLKNNYDKAKRIADLTFLEEG